MIVTAGATNRSIYVYFTDDDGGTAPGEPTTGLLFSDIETGGSASYVRVGAARTDFTLITLASASAAHADGGFILVDDTNMPGLCRVDVPDAAFATGVDQVMIHLVAAAANNSIMRPVVVDLTGNLTDVATKTDTDANAAVTDALIAGIIQAPQHLQTTTINTLAAQDDFTLVAGSSDDGAYDNATIVIEDSATTEQRAVIEGGITYTGSTKRVQCTDPAIFTMAVGDNIKIFAGSSVGNILDDPIPEPSGVFTWPSSVRDILGWVGALERNKTTQTATTKTLRNDADSSDIATATVSKTATTLTKEEYT